MDKNKFVKECSICSEEKYGKYRDITAVAESAANPGTYYCSSCANYVCMEYGISRLEYFNDKED